MRNSFPTKLTAIAAAVFLCCSALLIHSTARAQCPDSTGPAPNPDSIAWVQDSADVLIPGTDCYIWIYYCDRQVGDTLQAWLDGVLIDSNTSCDSLSDSAMIYEAHELLPGVVANSHLGLLEPCSKNQYVFVQVYTPQCWTPQHYGAASSGKVLLEPCSAYPYYCEKQCKACWDPGTGQIVFSDCVITTSIADIECLPEEGGWDFGNCYSAHCDGWLTSIEPAKVDLTGAIDMSMQAFPNPTSTNLTVTSSVAGEKVQVLDVLGREVMHGIISTNGMLMLDVSGLAAGTYYVSGGHREVQFVKK